MLGRYSVIGLCIGAQRSGKSTWLDNYIETVKKNGGCGLVYNIGKPTDFKSCVEHELPTFKSLVKEDKQNKELETLPHYLTMNGKKKMWSRFIWDNRGKGVKFADYDSRTRDLFFGSVYYHTSNTCLVLDDCKNIVRSGINGNLIPLSNRANHTGRLIGGKKKNIKGWTASGNDIFFVFHGIEQPNPDLWQYATHLVLFRCAFIPQGQFIDNYTVQVQVEKCFNILLNMPNYFYCIVDIKNVESYLYDNQKNKFYNITNF